MATSARKIDKDLKFFKRSNNLSPQLRMPSKFFGENDSSGVEGDSASSKSSSDDVRASLHAVTRRISKHSQVENARKLFKRKSRMFVIGASSTLKTEEDYLDSEVELRSDSRAEEDDDTSQTEPDLHATASYDPKATLITQASSAEKKTVAESTLQQKPGLPTESEFVLRKHSNFIFCWNVIIFLAILIDLVVIPLEISLQDVSEFSSFSLIAITVIQVTYLADIIVNLNKTYFDKHVCEVADLQAIRLRYFQSYDFLIDILACAPILAYRKIFYYPKGFNQLLLLIRIIKFFKVKQIVVEFHQRFYVNSKIYFLGYLISVLLIVDFYHKLHLETCIWYSVTILRYMANKSQAPILTEGQTEHHGFKVIPNHIEREMLWLPPTYRNIEHEDLLVQFYEGPILHRYSFIFYSCVLISAGNEIGPLTTTEVGADDQAWLASFYVILGLILTGVILGNISDAIENMNEEETKFERNLDELQVHLKNYKVPSEIQEKVMVHMQFCHTENIECNQEIRDFHYLAKGLRKELLCQKYDKLQKNVALFSALDQNVIFDICTHFK